MKAVLYASMLAVLCAVATAQAHDGPRGDGPRRGAPAAGRGGPGPGPADHRRFYGDYRHFGPDDRALWARGGWRHEYHDGRWGWWWFVDGLWYWYDQPVYPYPTTVSVVTYAPPAPAGRRSPPTPSWDRDRPAGRTSTTGRPRTTTSPSGHRGTRGASHRAPTARGRPDRNGDSPRRTGDGPRARAPGRRARPPARPGAVHRHAAHRGPAPSPRHTGRPASTRRERLSWQRLLPGHRV